MNWYPRKLKTIRNEKFIIFDKTEDHPLKIEKDSLKNDSEFKLIHFPSIKKNEWIDPLTAALSNVNREKSIGSFPTKNGQNYLEDDFEKWKSFVNSISKKSILLIESIKRQALLNENATNLLTNINFIQNLINSKSDLDESWISNSRVKALRTICLMLKNLNEIGRFDLYSYKFVKSIEILDEFNSLIFKRIEEKGLNDFEIGKETCMNWSYKICSIQELLPRLYLEIATLNTFGTYFIYDTTHKLMNTIQRLIEAVRGVGDPFIAIFVYVYLSKTVVDIFPEKKDIHFQIYSEFLNRFEQITQIESNLFELFPEIDFTKSNEICPYLNYTQFYVLPLNWILKCLLYKSDNQQSMNIYEELNFKLRNFQSSNLFFVLFNQMLPKLDAGFVNENYKSIIKLIEIIFIQNTNHNIPKYELVMDFSILFLKDNLATLKISTDDKLYVFNKIWKLIKMMNEKEYIICTNSWLDFAVKHFDTAQIDLILNDIIKHVISRKESIKNHNDLIQIFIKIIDSSIVDYRQFITSDVFVPFIEMFQKESSKVTACKIVIDHLIKNIRKSDCYLNYADFDYISILIYINKIMHDSVNQLTAEEERRELSYLINEFINLVQFDTYADNLDFLVECRSAFSFDNIIVQLVFNANKLSLDYYDKEGNQLNSNSFLKACFAFACITIPSVNDELKRTMLYFNTAQISLRCGFIEQTEFFIRNTINTIRLAITEKSCKRDENFFIGYIKNILSFLVLFPDDPSKGHLYLFRKLFKTVNRINLKQNDQKVPIYLCMLDFLCTVSQSKYPYHMENVESNDITLINCEKEFKQLIIEFGNSILEKILEYLEFLNLAKEYERHSNLAFNCFYSLLNNGQWSSNHFKLLFNIWQLAIKNSLSNHETILKSIKYTRLQSIDFDDNFLNDFANKMNDYYLLKKNKK